MTINKRKMKKTKYNIYIGVVSLLLLSVFSSCSDSFFEAEMGGRITPENHYKSKEDVQLSYLGCFALIQEIAENQVLVDGLRSDLIDITTEADFDMVNIVNHELSTNNRYVDPSAYYKVIINANEILPNLSKVLEIDRDFDSLTMKSYQGALVTVRNWAYFNLARLNNGITLIDPNDPSTTPQFLNKTEAINYLINDLLPFIDEENDLLRFGGQSLSDGDVIVSTGIDQYVLLGELYLEKGDYANAVKWLKFAVDGPSQQRSKFYMVDDLYSQEEWRNIFLNSYNRLPVRTAVFYSFESKQANALEEWFHGNYAYLVKPSMRIIEAFENETQQNGDPGDLFRGLGNSIDSIVENGTTKYFINKYSIDSDVPHGADIILYRAADMHLLLAEALNRNGESDKALLLVNQGFKSISNSDRGDYKKWSGNIGIRGRAFLRDISADNVEAIEDLIIEERMKELAFEGKRWFDLVRVAERRNNPAFLADKVASKFEDANKASEIRSKLMDKSNWYLPIPE